MKKLLTITLSILMCFGLVACGNEDNTSVGDGTPVSGGTYITVETGEPTSMNPDTVVDDNLNTISENMYNRLVKLNNNYEVLPDLAQLPEVSEDALTYTFKMVENATWHDGEKVTSEDVKYTYETIIEENYSKSSVFANVTSIETPDDYTVVFNLSAPDASFLANLAWWGTFILPEHIYADTDWLSNPHSTGEETPIGSGPFKFKEWNKGTDVRLVRNEEFWGEQKAYLDEIIVTIIPDKDTAYRAWLNGEVDEISSAILPTGDLQSLIDSGQYNLVNQVWPTMYYLTFNLNEGPFANPLVRQAVAYGIDRDFVSQKAYNGFKPASNYYISNIFTNALNEEAAQPSCDKEKAEQLLQEAGYKKIDGYYFDCELTIFEGFEDMSYVIVSELDEIGIKCKLNVIEYTVWEEQVWKNQQFDFTALGGFQGPDVLGAIRRWTKDGSLNVNGYVNENVEALVDKALASTSEEIDGYMKEIQTYLANDVPLLTMVTYTDNSLFNKNIHGHPMYTDEMGGSRSKAGFGEYTYTWLD